MSKASRRKNETNIVQTTGSNIEESKNEEPLFAGGELGQLQEILFGQHQRSTNQQIGLLQEQLTEHLLAISVELHARMDQLVDSLEQSRQHFDQQLDYLKNENQSGLLAANENISSTKAGLQRNIEALSDSTNEGAERLSVELVQHESKLLSELNRTKQVLQSEIRGSISSLDDTKLDKENLAQLFVDISGKLSSSANVGSN